MASPSGGGETSNNYFTSQVGAPPGEGDVPSCDGQLLQEPRKHRAAQRQQPQSKHFYPCSFRIASCTQGAGKSQLTLIKILETMGEKHTVEIVPQL